MPADPRTAVATVCLSGTLEDKLAAAAAAGFDGVEIFEPDLIASPCRRARSRRAAPTSACRSTSTSRSATSTRPTTTASPRNLPPRRAQVRRHGARWAPTPCWSAPRSPRTPSPTPTGSPSSCTAGRPGRRARAADRLRGARLGPARRHLGARRGTSSGGPTTRRSASAWTASTCSPATRDPTGSPAIPGEKIFFLQLADAPQLAMDVLQWSRHHRLFPGQGGFDLPRFLAARAGRRLRRARSRSRSSTTSSGRPTPCAPPWTRIARCCALAEATAAGGAGTDPVGGAGAAAVEGTAFVEIAVDGVDGPGARRRAHRPRLRPHRAAPHQAGASCWEQGRARVLVNASSCGPAGGDQRARRRVGWRAPTRGRSAARGRGSGRPVLARAPRPRRGRPLRRRRARRHRAVLRPHRRRRRLAGRLPAPRGVRARASGVTAVDHVGLDPALRLLRRGGPVLPRGPRAAARQRRRVRGPVRPGAQPRGHRPRPARPAGAHRLAAAPRRVGARRPGAAVHRVRHRRRRRHRPRRCGRPGRPCSASRTTTTTTSPPASTCRPTGSRRTASSASCTTRGRPVRTSRSAPRSSPDGSSSSSSSGSATTTGTAGPTPRCA